MLLKNMFLEGDEAHPVNDCGEELKMFKISKSSCEGEPRSLVYKILRTTCVTATEKSSPSLSDDSHPDFEDILRRSLSLSPSGFPSEDSKLLSFDSEVSPEDVIPSNYSNVVEIPYSPPEEPKPYTPPVKSEVKSEKSHPDFEDILRRSISLSPSGFPSEDSKLLSFDSEVSPEDVIPSNYSNVVEIPYSPPEEPKPYTPPVKSEGQDLRRSSRLQALRFKKNTAPDIPKQKEMPTDSSECKGFKVKRQKTVCKRRPSRKEKGTKKTKGVRSRSTGTRDLSKSDECIDKHEGRSSCSRTVLKRKIGTSTAKSGKPGLGETKRLRLQSMLIVQPNTSSCVFSYPRKQDSYPKFANVDPSRVLSTLHHHRNFREFVSSRKPIALFLTKKMPPAPQTIGNRQCHFKRMQRDFCYLRQKYQMLDLMTLDNCYAMSGYSLKRTEIMLMDLISGKEVVLTSDVDYESVTSQPLPSGNGFYVPQYLSGGHLLFHKESLSSQNLDRHSSDKEFRIAFVQALKVLYCDEGESV